MDNCETVHQISQQLLMTEIYNTRLNLNPNFIEHSFEKSVVLQRRCSEKLELPKTKNLALESRQICGRKSMGDFTTRAEKIRLPSNFQRAY